MADFTDALNAVIAELTPQPWDYTTPDGITLTVIPVGLKEALGEAEVTIRVTEDKTTAAGVDVTTTDLPDIIAALTEQRRGQVSTLLDGSVIARPDGDGVLLSVNESAWDDEGRQSHTTTNIRLPGEQRLPLASALARALDVARAWEE
jgi:hypothetical protein